MLKHVILKLKLIHICQGGKKSYRLLRRHDLISWSIFVISCHFSGAPSDEAVCCGLMETGLILRLNDVSWLGADFISKVHFSEAILGWSHRTHVYTSLDKKHHFLCRILQIYLCNNNNANLVPQVFLIRLLIEILCLCAIEYYSILSLWKLKAHYSRWGNKEMT